MSRHVRFTHRSFSDGLLEILSRSPVLGFLSFLLILLISSVIPLSFIWLTYWFFFDSSTFLVSSPYLRFILTTWSIIELCFFYYQCYLYATVQQQKDGPSLDSTEREKIYKSVFSNVKDIRCTLSKWFLDRPVETIDQESFLHWLSFAFYSKQLEQLDDQEFEDLNSLLLKIQTDHQLILTEKQTNQRLSHMKHVLDPVRVIFRPLAFYLVTDTLLDKVLARTLFFFKGYKHVRIHHLDLWTYCDESNNSNEPMEKPIIFFHGIGAGLLMYQPFISRIHRQFSRNRRIIFISMRCICMRYPSINDIPNMNETIESIHQIFRFYQFDKAIFIGHSYGTACLSWIAQKCPQYVANLIFIDPICFGLFEPYIIYNFVYRTPHRLGQLYMYYFVCREMGISYVISRHFWWTQNNLFLEHFLNETNENIPTHVLLSGRDCIVNVHLVKEYLIKHNINYSCVPGLSHGDFMHHRCSWEQICRWISNTE